MPQEQDQRLPLINLPAVPTALLPLEHVQQAVAPAGDFPVADVHAHGVRGGERAAHVSLRLGEDDVHLWREHAAQGHGHAEAHREGHRDDLVVAAEVDRHERQPDDARGVHGEGDVFGFVEIGGYVACLEGVVSAAHDQEAVVSQRSHDAHVAGVANEEDFSYAGVRFDRFRRLQDDQGDLQSELEADKDEGDHHLSPSAHEPRFPGANLFFAASQNTSDPVGFGDQGGVAHGSREPHEEPLEVAGGHGGAGDEGEGTQVPQEDSSQDDVAEFPAGGLHHWCVTIQDEDEGNERRDQDAQAGKNHLDNGLWIAPLQVAHWDLLTAWKEGENNKTILVQSSLRFLAVSVCWI